ncbi:expressed protein [Batrachochytrium dendrobatidis JAM81]|uniref:Expressed protein n=1 Tax=Batrachochytrium dendrobatidis (strain JAM81 / FGSC 10211) TaxID=684364 RepID=F4NTV9_BATDJ|nr:uncharacterized protein BATDEDRAFT_34264 [Batrachochytrium dendrobatidis JAM81]EGF83550.1 expressed protein [Batrachochytrium dendrobatidis JAM81]|eukprot:XP_006675805.1 expressed protein [Batrachochytrium dendrobatidis JAM81]
MPPRKTPPQALDAVRNMKGITFSFNLTQSLNYKQSQQQDQQSSFTSEHQPKPQIASQREIQQQIPIGHDLTTDTAHIPISKTTSIGSTNAANTSNGVALRSSSSSPSSGTATLRTGNVSPSTNPLLSITNPEQATSCIPEPASVANASENGSPAKNRSSPAISTAVHSTRTSPIPQQAPHTESKASESKLAASPTQTTISRTSPQLDGKTQLLSQATTLDPSRSPVPGALSLSETPNASPGRVPIDSAYDMSVKVHAITSDALLYRMRGICTPEFAALKQPGRTSSQSGAPVRNTFGGSSRFTNHRRTLSNSSADSSRQYTSPSSGDEFHGSAGQPVARRGRPPNSANRARSGKPSVGRPPGSASASRFSGSGVGGRPSGTSGKRKLGSAFPSAHNPPTVIEQSTDLDLDNDSADYIDDEKGSIRKRKVIHSTTSPGECTWCGVKKTAQWRKGPSGSRGLCNACGLEWAKQIRHEAKKSGISNHDAEIFLIKNYRTSERYLRYMREHNFSLDGPADDAETTAAAIAAVGSSSFSDYSSPAPEHPHRSVSPTVRLASLSPNPARVSPSQSATSNPFEAASLSPSAATKRSSVEN